MHQCNVKTYINIISFIVYTFTKWKTGFFVHYIQEIWKTTDRMEVNTATACTEEIDKMQTADQKQIKSNLMHPVPMFRY